MPPSDRPQRRAVQSEPRPSKESKGSFQIRRPKSQTYKFRSSRAEAAFRALVQNAADAVERFGKHQHPQGWIPTHLNPQGLLSRDAAGGVELALVASARHLYGLANAGAESRAFAMAEFFRAHFVDRSSSKPRFLESVRVDADGRAHQVPQSRLTARSQAAGLTGLVALYAKHRDPGLRDEIRALHVSFVERFWDEEHGGFWHELELDDAPRPYKSVDSTVGTAVAYLLELAAVDKLPSSSPFCYERLLASLGQLTTRYVIRSGPGLVINETFSRDWSPTPIPGDWRTSKHASAVGHQMQAAWFLLGLHERGRAENFGRAAVRLLGRVLEDCIDWTNGLVYSALDNDAKPARWGARRSAWQQAFAIAALLRATKLSLIDSIPASQPGRSGRDALELLLERWPSFLRPQGGHYQEVESDGTPVVDPVGHEVKATYPLCLLAAQVQD